MVASYLAFDSKVIFAHSNNNPFSGMHFDFSAENGHSLEASAGTRDDDLAAALAASRIEF